MKAHGNDSVFQYLLHELEGEAKKLGMPRDITSTLFYFKSSVSQKRPIL